MSRSLSLLLLLCHVGVSRSAAPRWVEVSANGTWPQPRFSHTAAMMPDGATMLVFGGNNFDAVNELFAFDVVRREWRKIKAGGDVPCKRYGHQAVATEDGRMLVFGGYNGTFLNDVHVLKEKADGEWTWTRVATSGVAPPIARDGHSAVLAPDGTTILVFGGFDGTDQLDDLFALDTTTYEWRELELDKEEEEEEAAAEEVEEEEEAAAGKKNKKGGKGAARRPAPRYMHSAVRCDGGFLLYGGYLAGGDFADDLWRLTLLGTEDGATRARWTKVKGGGKRPPGSFGHAAAVDSSGKLWISGGFGVGSFSNALHAYDPSSKKWSLVDARGSRPSPRHKHTLIATPDDKLLLFGGNDFGPTRGFYELDVSGADASLTASGGGGLAGLAVASRAPLSQIIALWVVALAAWLCQAGELSGAACGYAVLASLVSLLVAEALVPPPGGFVARIAGKPKGGAQRFERSLVNVATDLVAAVAAASVASLLASSGMGSLSGMIVK